jgi:hypothetical protein
LRLPIAVERGALAARLVHDVERTVVDTSRAQPGLRQVLHEELAITNRRGVQLHVGPFVVATIEPLVEEERLRVAGTDHEQLVAADQRRGHVAALVSRIGRRAVPDLTD